WVYESSSRLTYLMVVTSCANSTTAHKKI
ncbi:uncharacterized protein METZ01_LOCUS466529, partial [marine metagenome]